MDDYSPVIDELGTRIMCQDRHHPAVDRADVRGCFRKLKAIELRRLKVGDQVWIDQLDTRTYLVDYMELCTIQRREKKRWGLGGAFWVGHDHLHTTRPSDVGGAGMFVLQDTDKLKNLIRQDHKLLI